MLGENESDAADEWVEYEPVVGEFSSTAEDYEAAYLLAADHRSSPRSLRILLGGCLLVVWMGFAATDQIGVWAAFLVLIIVGIVSARRQQAWMGRAVFRSRPRAADTVRVTVDHESVRRSASAWDSEYSWQLVTGWLESPTHFVLVNAQGVMDMLPKHAFAESRWPELRALFEDCVETPATPPAPSPSSRSTEMSPGRRRVVIAAVFVVVLAGAYAWFSR